MVNSNADALGIIFPNSYDTLVPELVGKRLMASIPFAGRYRMVDFILSSMVNSGIGNISIAVRQNYLSLMDHLGSGREWDLTRKNGGLNIVPPFAENGVKLYTGRVEAIANLLDYLRRQKEKYVVMSDSNIAVNFDFKALMDEHADNHADITMVYAEEEIPQGFLKPRIATDGMYYTLNVDADGRVRKIHINSKEPGVQKLAMNIYIMEREFLVKLFEIAFARGYSYFERDILAQHLDKMHVQAYEFCGYKARICDMQSYFRENMKLLDEKNLDGLFAGDPIYTKIRDDNPTRYINGSKASNIMAADGCVIEGEVENSILFRGVRIGKGAVVKNCVLMQDTVVEDGVKAEYVISDKNVKLTAGKEVRGTETFPVYIAKHQVV